MKQQINDAYAQVHDFPIDYASMNRINYLKSYMIMKSKVKDIDKNKILLDNLELINQCLHSGKAWTLYLPLYLQDLLIWRKNELSLREADYFSFRDVQAIVNGIEQYSKIWMNCSSNERTKQIVKL